MRIVNWNIDQGGRNEMVGKIIKTLLAFEADVIVLPEYRKDNPRIKDELVRYDFKPHIPSMNYETGNQVAIFTKKILGFETQELIVIPEMEGLAVFCSSDLWTIGGVFFPRKEKNQPSMHKFLEWIALDPFKLGKIPTVLTGDFNCGFKASEWNKGKTSSEYNQIRRWIEEGIWIDCCSKPDPNSEYARTFCILTPAKPSFGEKWAKGSSRPDHYFVSKLVSFKKINVLNGYIQCGISDHEPMIGDFDVV